MESETFPANLGLRPLAWADAGLLQPLGLTGRFCSGGLGFAVAWAERNRTQDGLRNAWDSRQGVGRRGRTETGDT